MSVLGKRFRRDHEDVSGRPSKRRSKTGKSGKDELFETKSLAAVIQDSHIDKSKRAELKKDYFQLSKGLKECQSDSNKHKMASESVLEWKRLIEMKAKTIILHNKAKESKNKAQMQKWNQYLKHINTKLQSSQTIANSKLKQLKPRQNRSDNNENKSNNETKSKKSSNKQSTQQQKKAVSKQSQQQKQVQSAKLSTKHKAQNRESKTTNNTPTTNKQQNQLKLAQKSNQQQTNSKPKEKKQGNTTTAATKPKASHHSKQNTKQQTSKLTQHSQPKPKKKNTNKTSQRQETNEVTRNKGNKTQTSATKTDNTLKKAKTNNINIDSRLHDPNLPTYAKETVSSATEWNSFFTDTFDDEKEGILRENARALPTIVTHWEQGPVGTVSSWWNDDNRKIVRNVYDLDETEYNNNENEQETDEMKANKELPKHLHLIRMKQSEQRNQIKKDIRKELKQQRLERQLRKRMESGELVQILDENDNPFESFFKQATIRSKQINDGTFDSTKIENDEKKPEFKSYERKERQCLFLFF